MDSWTITVILGEDSKKLELMITSKRKEVENL